MGAGSNRYRKPVERGGVNGNCIARAEHEEFAKRIDAENTRQNRRIEALEQSVDRFGRIASSVERLATNMEGMLKEQERQGERLDKLEGKPGENWNGMVKSILAAIGSAIGGGLVVAIATMLIK